MLFRSGLDLGAIDHLQGRTGLGQHLAGGIELDHQRRKTPGIQFAVQHVLAVEEEHVVLRIDAMAAEPARHPLIGQRLWKCDIDLVPRRARRLSPYEMLLSESQERMLLVARKGCEDKVIAICKKWDLDAVVIGSKLVELLERQPADNVALTGAAFIREIRAALDKD